MTVILFAFLHLLSYLCDRFKKTSCKLMFPIKRNKRSSKRLKFWKKTHFIVKEKAQTITEKLNFARHIQSKLSTTEGSSHCREVAVMGKKGCNMTPGFFSVGAKFFLEMLVVEYRYVTQLKCINKTEHKQTQKTTTRAANQIS